MLANDRAAHAQDGRGIEVVRSLSLSDREVAILNSAVKAAALAAQGEAERPAEIQLACGLPGRLVRTLRNFLLDEHHSPVLVIQGLPIDDGQIGPTPSHWSALDNGGTTEREELYLSLVGALLGHVFSWATLQGGRLIQNVLPIYGDQNEQSGHGTVQLAWHTEDAFHPFRCDYLLLLALRNPSQIATTVASVTDIRLPEEMMRVLSEPRFVIRPDNEHARNLGSQAGQAEDGQDLGCWWNPSLTGVLFGDPAEPYLRIDPYFMEAAQGDSEAGTALQAATERLEGALRDVVLRPGEMAVIDNYRAVHGRKAFQARYDGTDRWLKKALVTRNLRQSRASRLESSSQVIQYDLASSYPAKSGESDAPRQ